MDVDNARTIGRRLREIRQWRDKSLRVVAELAGITESYLSLIERGKRPLNSRSLVEALAAALEVAPGELTGAHELTSTKGMGEAHAAVVALRVALADNALDDPADDLLRPWSELAATLQRVNSELRPAADYAAMGLVLPGLITDLHAVAASDLGHRREALGSLLDVYTAATFTAKQLGESDLAALAAMHARAVAAELGSPAHTALAEYLRAHAVASPARARSLVLATRAADRVAPWVGTGEGAKVRELACGVDPTAVKSATRQAAFYADLGQGLATERAHRHEAVAALRTAERLAPQRVRANPFVRETVVDLMRRARRDAIGRELRGMAYRMGLAG